MATYELIASQTLGSDASGVAFSSIPQTYDDLVVVCSVRTARSATIDFLNVVWNSNTANYSYRRLEGDGSAANSNSGTGTTTAAVNGDTSTANTFGSTEIYVPNYAGSSNKSYSVTSLSETNATTAQMEARAYLWANTSAITSVAISSANSANLKTGSSFYLYAVTHS